MPAPHACGPPSPSEWHHPTGWEVADVFRLYGPDYQRRDAISATQERVITDLIACRTAQLGGHAEPCPTCRFERFAYHSCRNRHGPKCHTLAPVKWLQARQAELLPVPYVHAVFTLPQALNGLIQAHPRQLLSLLFQSVGQTLKQVGRHQRGGQLGATLILPTWDPTWGAHVHLHGLIPAGVLDEPGDSWVPRHPHFRLSVHALSEVVRGQFVEALNPAHDQRQLEVGTTAGSRSDREDLASLLDRLYAHQGGVYSKAPFAKPQQVLDDLGRYTHRVAMSNHRLVEVAEGQVRLTWRNRRQGGRQDTLTLEAVELIRRFLWPILPRGLVRIRHVGCLANRAKARALKRCRHVLGLPTEVPHPTLPSVAEWMVQVKGIEIERCPSGGHRPLQRFPLAPLPAAQGSQTMPSILDSS